MIKKLFTFNRIILVFLSLAFTFLVFGCVSFSDTEEITLSQESVELGIGEDIQITATLKIDKNSQVTWTSDNPNIATVNNGLIEGVSAGDTVITVSFGDVTASVNVTVTIPTIDDLAFALDDTKYLNARMKINIIISMMGENVTNETITDIDGQNAYTKSEGFGIEAEEYIVFINNTIYVAYRSKTDNQWMDWVIEVLEVELESELDFSLFSEDDFIFVDGYFELKDEKLDEYFETLELGDDSDVGFDSFTLKLQIKDGLINLLIFEVDFVEEEITSSMKIEIEITNIGTTEVVIPDDLLEAITAYNNQG